MHFRPRFLPSISARFLHSKSLNIDIANFDPDFYRQNYADLFHLKREKDLLRHYILHGAKEGRFKNLEAAEAYYNHQYGPLPQDFDPAFYRQLNEDLARVLNHDWQFAFHYLEHGRKEGRPYKTTNALGYNEPWHNIFRLYDFITCAHAWLEEVPATREAGINLFVRQGIERLTPINLGYIFDPAYYRATYVPDTSLSDAELYRDWLYEGLAQGRFPNEQRALRNLVSDGQFPEAFDWITYKTSLPEKTAGSCSNRVDLLKHYFDHGFEKAALKFVKGDQATTLFAAIGDYHLVKQHFRLARTAYDLAIAHGDQRCGTLHRRGDANAALGNSAAAFVDFEKAATNPQASVWSHIHAARMAVKNEAFDQAFSTLAKARPLWIKNIHFREAIKYVIDQLFTARTNAAFALYAAGERARGDMVITETLDTIRAQMLALEDFPPALKHSNDGHVVILANQDLAQCKYYRVEQKRRQLEHAGYRVEVYDQNDPISFIKGLVGARAAIFYRVPAFPNVLRAILTAKATGIPLFYDIDDLVFNAEYFPDTFASYEGQINRDEYNGLLYGVPLYRYAMKQCDHGIASTLPLARQIQPLVKSKDCFILRNGLDERNDNAIARGGNPLPARETITIFYGSGTKAHNSDFNELAGAALLNLFLRRSEIRLVVVGHLKLRPEFEQFSSRITQIEFVSDLDDYWSILSACDINIAVLAPGVMADCKSEIKWLEAAVLQVPSIVSRTATYEDVLTEGEDVLFADNVQGWIDAFETLISSRDRRLAIGAAARQKALNFYSLDAMAALWHNRLGPPRTLSSKERNAERGLNARPDGKIKVLICNVFFAPQSYGGATRVVENNVDYILENCPDIELSIFATDEGVETPGQFRLDNYKGVPVYRLSTPVEANMDWRPFNPENESAFERVIDAIKPDLIHFHCIQRLTATIVEVAQQHKIPYLITAHDGWWVSDYQFFVDEDDQLHLPTTNMFPNNLPTSVTIAQSIARRTKLAALMAGAVHVLAVSNSFAEIYRRAGVGNVISVPNGLPPYTPFNSEARSSEIRLSLGHIGGRSSHKGATLVEAVLRTTAFDHLHLIMVDMTMEPGQTCETVWGTTPVTLCGPYPQNEINKLYAQFDVLLAPSIWPESFGLVAREAHAHGLWVIASDRGAMGEDIRQDENGFVIDVTNATELVAALRKLDTNISLYKEKPQYNNNYHRSSHRQGQEVIDIYKRITRKI